jgi:truncated hemoglobin YjbI
VTDEVPIGRSPELFAKIGAEQLRAVITDFYARVFGDVMIGFMFQGKDRQRLIDKEAELAAVLLGAPGATYTGKPMRTAHAPHTIFGGHFERRLQILRETMRDHHVDPDVQRVWIEHTQSLRSQITRDQGSECKDTSAAGPKLAIVAPQDPDRPVKLGRK